MTDKSVISTAELKECQESENLVVLDCRFALMDPEAGVRSWHEGHIPGAVHADLDKVLAGPLTSDSGRHPLPDPASLASWLGRQGTGSDTHVVAYDGGSGAIAARAWWLLRWLGHENVSVLDGGFAAWNAEGRRIERERPPGGEHRNFVPNVRAGAIATTRDIVEGLPDILLVDARDAARFRGEREPIDAVAGHIPGSRSLPYSANLDSTGHWKAPGALQAIYRPLLGEAPGGDWVVMCGSGVTACHLAIGGIRAGYRMPRVYIGSWSEWIQDPDRPVEKDI